MVINMKIKLQAWLKKEKKMVNVIAWYHPDYLNYIEYSTSQSSDGVHQVKLEDVELRLFTGRKDMDGRDVYRGDILKYITVVDGKERESVNSLVVEWNDERACFTHLESLNKKRIVGNIYKNSGMIK